MRTPAAWIVGTSVMLAGIVGTAATSFAHPCYVVREGDRTTSVENGSPIALRYASGSRGTLNNLDEIYKFNHLKQSVYEIDGKATLLLPGLASTVADGLRIMATTDGTAITGARYSGTDPVDAPGAHLGLTVHLLRFAGDGLFLGPIFLECTSSEVSSTPNVWKCNGKIEADIGDGDSGQLTLGVVLGIHLPFELVKVNPLDEPACSVFEDGENFPSLPGGDNNATP